jgi:hypothetical protein
MRKRCRDGGKIGRQNRDDENFSDACKKSLAFLNRVGVGFATVQGLKFAQSSLDGEALRGFQKLVWSESAKCGSWRILSVSDLLCLRHPFQIPFTQLNAIKARCLLSVSPNVIEEAVWMLGVSVGCIGLLVVR